MEPVDVRSDRIAQSFVGVVLLAAYVFRMPYLLPILAVLLGVGALLGAEWNPFHRAFERWVAPRLGAGTDSVAADTIRAQDALGAAVLAIASLAYISGVGGLAWLLAIAMAVVAIVAATIRIHVGELIWRRRGR